MGSVIAWTVKAFVAFVRELRLVLCFHLIFSVNFMSFISTFAPFILLPAILLLGRTLHWDVTLSLAFRAVGQFSTILLEVAGLFASKAESTI